MAVIEIAKIQVRRGQENQTGVPQLDPGEFAWAEDTENLYIGKRIAEGAVDDNNTRILTENDLVNIFSYLRTGGSVANTSSYRYREDAPHINSITSTIGVKLDNYVSLTDYDVTPSYTATDITLELSAAVNDLFYNNSWNDWRREDARRTLTIPAGNYFITAAISLPPYARIKGEGKDVTTLILRNPNTNLFRTIDAQGNNFESANMQSGTRRSRGVQLEGMSLLYSNTMTPLKSLVSLDNSREASIKDVAFKTQFNVASTTTYGPTAAGIGLEVRSGGTVGVEGSQDIIVEHCDFDGLYRGFQSTGTTVRPVIQHSKFSNMQQGVAMYTIDTGMGPTGAVITDNRFENIVSEGIWAGENPNGRRGNHLSENNFFVGVGNGSTNGFNDETLSGTGATAVIRFDSSGNKSINDNFNRRNVANTTTNASFWYNRLVQGRVSLNDESVFTATIATNSYANVAKLGATGQEQSVTMRYQLNNSSLSRGGTLLLNIDRDGNPTFTDTYNYTESYYEVNTSTNDMTGLPGSGIDVFVASSTATGFAPLVGGNGNNMYFMTGSNEYFGEVSQVAYVAWDGIQYVVDLNPTDTLTYVATKEFNPDLYTTSSYSTSTVAFGIPPIFEKDVTGWSMSGPGITTYLPVTSFSEQTSATYITVQSPFNLQVGTYTFTRNFNFATPGETFSLVKSVDTVVYFETDDTKLQNNNYIMLRCNNASVIESIDLEYQIDILT